MLRKGSKMVTKYGIRHYPQTGAYLAFKDTTLFGLVLRRRWLALDGSVLGRDDIVGKAMGLSKEEAMESIMNYFSKHVLLGAYVDEYVYKEEWWHE